MTDAEKARIAELVNVKLGRDTVHHSVITRVVAAVLQVQGEERQRVRREKAMCGEAVGGRIEFGYCVDDKGRAKEHPSEQAMIRRARAMAAKGQSLRTIAGAIQAEGYAVSHTTIANLLKRGNVRAIRSSSR